MRNELGSHIIVRREGGFMSNQHDSQEGGGKTVTAERTRTSKPPLYAVIILNDDFTPMDFVVHVLMKFFYMDEQTAMAIMLNVHHKGHEVCGTYTKEIAETKANQVIQLAQENEYPLQCKIEPA